MAKKLQRLVCNTARIKLVADIDCGQLSDVLDVVCGLEYLIAKTDAERNRDEVMWDVIPIPEEELVTPPPKTGKKGSKKGAKEEKAEETTQETTEEAQQ